MTRLTIMKPGVARVDALFDMAERTLDKAGYRAISLKENALLRMQKGKDSKFSRGGNCTREGFIYVPKKGIFFVLNSPVLDEPGRASLAHSHGREFYISDEQARKALEDSVQIPYNLKSIPTREFGENDLTIAGFGNAAGKYGKFLNDAGIEEMPIGLPARSYIDGQDKAFVRQAWLHKLDDNSELNGKRFLDSSFGLLGVAKTSKVDLKDRLIEGLESGRLEEQRIIWLSKKLLEEARLKRTRR